MMLRPGLVLLFFISAACCCAQKKIFECPLPGIMTRVKALPVFEEEKNNIYLTLATKESIRRFIINPAGKSKLLLEQLPEKEKSVDGIRPLDKKVREFYTRHRFISGMIDRNHLLELFQHSVSKNYYLLKTDLLNGGTIIKDTVKVTGYEVVVHTFVKNSELVVMAHRKNSKRFFLYSFSSDKKPHTGILSLKADTGNEDEMEFFSDSKHDIARPPAGKIVVVPNNLWLPVFSDRWKHIAYSRDDHFILSFNSKGFATWLIDISLSEKNYRIRKFEPAIGKLRNSSATGASFLVDSLLIASAIDSHSLSIHFFHSGTRELLHQVEINQNNLSQFIRKGTNETVLAGAVPNQADFHLFLKAARKNQLYMTGYREDDQLFVSLGIPERHFKKDSRKKLLALGFETTNDVVYPGIALNTSFSLPYFSPSGKTVKNGFWTQFWLHLWENRYNNADMDLYYMNGYYYFGNSNTPLTKFALYRFDAKGE